MSKTIRIQNIASSVSKVTNFDESDIKDILHKSIDVIIEELKSNNTVQLDKFYSFSRKKVKRSCFVEKPKNGEKPKYKMAYFSTVRTSPLKRTDEDLIVEITKEEYENKK